MAQCTIQMVVGGLPADTPGQWIDALFILDRADGPHDHRSRPHPQELFARLDGNFYLLEKSHGLIGSRHLAGVRSVVPPDQSGRVQRTAHGGQQNSPLALPQGLGRERIAMLSQLA